MDGVLVTVTVPDRVFEYAIPSTKLSNFTTDHKIDRVYHSRDKREVLI